MAKSCMTCKHIITHRSCNAFPGGIPLQIISGEVIHDKKIKGDNGIVYERISKPELQKKLDGG